MIDMSPEEFRRLGGSTILQYPMGNGSPRFFGWVNSPAAPIGVIADLLAESKRRRW